MSRTEYSLVIEPLSEEDGGGYLAHAVGLPGCFSDGETPQEAAKNIQGAISAWMESAVEMGRAIPSPVRVGYDGGQSPEAAAKIEAAE